MKIDISCLLLIFSIRIIVERCDFLIRVNLDGKTSVLLYYESTSYDEPCTVLDDFIYAAYSFYMDIQHTGKKNYTIIFGNRRNTGIPDEVINLLNDSKFTIDSSCGKLSTIPEAKVAETVTKICMSLQQLA